MHRLVVAAAAASVLAVTGAAQAGGYGGYGGYDSYRGSAGYGGYAPCGCQSYDEDAGGCSYGGDNRYVDLDDLYARGSSYSYQSYDYVPFESSTYGYRYDDVYGRGDYDFGGTSYRSIPDERSYSHSYDYSRRYRAPRSYSYRSYHYEAPHYARPHDRARRPYGRSSADGERG